MHHTNSAQYALPCHGFWIGMNSTWWVRLCYWQRLFVILSIPTGYWGEAQCTHGQDVITNYREQFG